MGGDYDEMLSSLLFKSHSFGRSRDWGSNNSRLEKLHRLQPTS